MAVFKTKTEVSDVVATIKKVREDLKVYYGAGEKSGNDAFCYITILVGSADPHRTKNPVCIVHES